MVRTGMQGRVREASAALDRPGGFSRADVFRRLQPRSSKEEHKMSGAFTDLIKRGEIRPGAGGRFRYDPARAPGPKKRRAVFRAMYIMGTFCVKDIVIRSDAEHSYVGILARKLTATGYLEKSERRAGHDFMYRVRHKDRFYKEIVKGNGFPGIKKNRRREKVAE